MQCEKHPVIITDNTVLPWTEITELCPWSYWVKLIPEDEALDNQACRRAASCMAVECHDAHADSCQTLGVAGQAVRGCGEKRSYCKLYLFIFSPMHFSTMNTFMQFRSGAAQQNQVFTAKSLTEWRLTTVCWSKALGLYFLWKGTAVILCGIWTVAGLNPHRATAGVREQFHQKVSKCMAVFPDVFTDCLGQCLGWNCCSTKIMSCKITLSSVHKLKMFLRYQFLTQFTHRDR